MNTTSLTIRTDGAREKFVDVASILAVALIGLVLLVVTNPRIGRDLGTLLRPAVTQSVQVTTSR